MDSSNQGEIFSPLLPLRSDGPASPVFFLHGVTGDAERFAGLLARLKTCFPAYGVQAQAFDTSALPLSTLEDLARYYLAAIRQVQPHGPYYFVGFSFGGMLAFEMAQQLRAANETVDLLAMLDAPDMSFLDGTWGEKPFARRLLDRFHQLGSQLRTACRMRGRLAHLKEKLVTVSLRLIYRFCKARGLQIPGCFRNATELNYFAARNYRLKSYPGRVVLFKTTGEVWDERLPHDLGWGRVAQGGTEIIDLPGTHYEAFREPTISVLAARLDECLRAHRPTLSQPVRFSDLSGSLPLAS